MIQRDVNHVSREYYVVSKVFKDILCSITYFDTTFSFFNTLLLITFLLQRIHGHFIYSIAFVTNDKTNEVHIWTKEGESMKSKSEIIVACENYASLDKE
jgi:hypothetical protein